jgi:hypothetical protein
VPGRSSTREAGTAFISAAPGCPWGALSADSFRSNRARAALTNGGNAAAMTLASGAWKPPTGTTAPDPLQRFFVRRSKTVTHPKPGILRSCFVR